MKDKEQHLQTITELLLFFVSVVSFFFAFPYCAVFVYEEIEPSHRFLRGFFKIEIAMEFKYAHFIFYSFFQAYLCGSLLFYWATITVLYSYSMYAWLSFLVDSAERNYTNYANDSKKSAKVKDARLDIHLLSSYRMMLVMNRIANLIYGNYVVAHHLGCLLAINVVCLFGAIRYNEMLSGVSLVLLFFSASLCTFMFCVEVIIYASLPEKAEAFLLLMRRNNVRRSVISKGVKSCWNLQLEAGKPFFTISHVSSFLMYMEQLLSFLTTFLLST